MNPSPSSSRARRAVRLALGSAAVVATLAIGPAAGAQVYGTTPPTTGPSVLPNRGEAPTVQSGGGVNPGASAKPAAVSSGAASRRLAVTGSDMAGIAALGGTAVVAGTGLVLASRRRRATA